MTHSQAIPATSTGAAALERLLRERPLAIVLAMSDEGRLTQLPESLALTRRMEYERSSGVDLLVAGDHQRVLEAWQRAQQEPVVTVDVHLIADPDQVVPLYFLDLRADHGVHVVILDAPDPTRVLESIEAVDGRRRPVGRVRRDAFGSILEVDAAAAALLGWPVEDLIGRNSLELLHPDDVDRAVEAWMAMRAHSGGARVQVRFQHANGHHVWLEITNENHLDDPTSGCVTSELVDISEEMATLAAVLERERQLQRLAEALPIGICHLRIDREVAYTNPPLTALLGAVDSVAALVAAVAPGDREAVQQAINEALAGEDHDLEVGLFGGSGERRAELTLRALREGSALTGVIVCAADVTDRSRLRVELEHRATHDALSGCLNRAAVVELVDRHLRAGRTITVAYLDIDEFKAVNDQHGHSAGDEILRAVAGRLRRATRADDAVGRIGGDEFVVVCPEGREPFGPSALVARLAAAFADSVELGDCHIPLAVSIGAASSSGGQVLDAEALLHLADQAMYERKRWADASPSDGAS